MKQKKSIKELREDTIKVFKKKRGIRRKTRAWKKKFMRIKQDYKLFVKKILAHGCSTRNELLFWKNLSFFLVEMH